MIESYKDKSAQPEQNQWEGEKFCNSPAQSTTYGGFKKWQRKY